MDVRRLPLPGFPVRVLQQRLCVDVVDDSHDNQPLRADHLPAPLPEDLPDEVHHPPAVSCVVHLVFDYGEMEVLNFSKNIER